MPLLEELNEEDNLFIVKNSIYEGCSDAVYTKTNLGEVTITQHHLYKIQQNQINGLFQWIC